MITVPNQASLLTGATMVDPKILWAHYNLYTDPTYEMTITHKHKSAKIAARLFPSTVATVLMPAAVSASKSVTAANAWPPATQRLFTIALRGTSEIDDPEKLKPKNQIRNTMHPFESESTTGISFKRKGGAEYCQAMMTTRIAAMMLSQLCVAREVNRMMMVENQAAASMSL
jgi:hypothetical protein